MRKEPAAPVTLDDLAMLLIQVEPDDAAGVAALRDAMQTYAAGAGAGGPDGMMVEAGALALGEMDAEAGIAEAGACIEAAMQARDARAPQSAAQLEAADDTRDTHAADVSSRRRSGARIQSARSARRARGIRSGAVPVTPAAPEVPAAPVAPAVSAAPAMPADWADQVAEPEVPSVADATAWRPEHAAGEAATDDAGAWGMLPAEADAELADGFVMESLEYLSAAEAALLVLEANTTDSESVNAVFRAFHTIKGTAGFLGLTSLTAVAHHAESLLSLVRTGDVQLTGGFAGLAFRSVDMLRVLVEGVRLALTGVPRVKPAGYDALLSGLERAIATRSADDAELAVAAVPDRIADADAPKAGAADSGSAAADAHGEAQEAWIRVRTDRLDKLVDTIGELVIAQSMIAQDDAISALAHEALGRKVGHASKIVRELQDLSISMRMVPLKPLFQKMARVVRDTAKKSAKVAVLRTHGEDTEIDRNMVDVIGDPLVHMLRNAIDHGIELPAARREAGKDESGTIRLSAYHAGGSVVVELQDDGRGLDRSRIVRKAIAQGLIESDRYMTDHDVYSLIFEPGFSTAEQVTDLSGRGVGMDVVRRSVEALRGRVDISAEPGRGTTFSMRLPLTLAMTDGMLVRCGTERYIVPTVNIQMSFRPDASALSTIGGKGELVMLRGEPLPILRLHRLFNVETAVLDPSEALLVVIGAGERRCALLVDELLGQQQVVAKTLGQGMGKIQGVSGGAILGDGRVGLILDAGEMIQLARSSTDTVRPASAA